MLTKLPHILTILLACATLSFAKGAKHNLRVAADTVLMNGYIYTVDANKTVASCLAIKDKRIVYVGNCDGVRSYIGSTTQQIDLGGKFVLPGFVDSHMHSFSVGWYMVNLTIQNPYSIEDTLQEIRDYAAAHPEKTVIEGVGYMRSLFEQINGKPPGKDLLDAIDNTRPIMIIDRNGHSAWVNSKTLELLGYDENTPDPANGKIERIPNTGGYGEPSGQLLEDAYFLGIEKFPGPTMESSVEAIKAFSETLASYGVTTLHDMAVDVSVDRQVAMYNAANSMASQDELNLRIFGSWYVNPARGNVAGQIKKFAAVSDGYKSSNLQTKSFKFLIDGILEEGTGYMSEPYCDSPVIDHKGCNSSNYGMDIWGLAKQDLVQAFKQVNQMGYQINGHVIGDAAVTKMLDALEKAGVLASMRPSLEHVQMASKKDIARMGKLGVSANVTPLWMGLDDYFTNFYYPHLGFSRAYGGLYPYQSMFDAGVNVTTSSDWYVSLPNFGQQIFMGLTRLYPKSLYNTYYCCEDGYEKLYPYIDDLTRVLKPDEFDPVNKSVIPIASLPPFTERAKTIHQVIEAATINGAKANLADDVTGSLEVGKSADLVVLDTNYIEVFKQFQKSGMAKDLEPIAESKVLQTIFEGRVVYDSEKSKVHKRKISQLPPHAHHNHPARGERTNALVEMVLAQMDEAMKQAAGDK